MNDRFRTVMGWLALSILVLLPKNSPAQQPYEESPSVKESVALIQGLAQRRLFHLVDIYTAGLLDSEDLNRNEQAAIVLEQMRTKAAQAVSLTGDARQAAWQEAEKIARDFLAANTNHPRKLLIDVQNALTHFANGQLIQQEISAEIAPPDTKSAALDQFRLATQKFQEIEMSIEKQLPIARNKTLIDGELTPQQLVNLKNNVRYRLAVTNLAKSSLYDADDSLNQIDALNQVLVRLNEVIIQSNADVPLWWDAQISRAKCYRTMNNEQAVDQLFQILPESKLSEDLLNNLLQEKIQSAVDFRQASRWPGLINSYAQIKKPSPQLQLAVLQMMMASAADSSAVEKKQWQSQATRLVGNIENIHGPYWGRRADVLLVGSIKSVPEPADASSDFEILIRLGETAFRKRNLEDATKAFSKAVALAIDAGNADQAIATSARLAECREQQNRHADAAHRLFEIVDKFPDRAVSAAVHLRGCWNLAKSDEADPEALFERLQKQVDTWPQAEVADQARLWLGNELQTKSQWKLAVETYLAIDFSGSRILEAVEQIELSARRWIESVRSTNGDWKSAARQFVALTKTKLPLVDASPNSKWQEPKRMLLLSLVDIGLPAEAVQAEEALEWLNAALAGDDGSVSWRSQALAWRAVALAKRYVQNTELEVPPANLQLAIKALPSDAVLMGICLRGIKQNVAQDQLKKINSSLLLICNKALADENVADVQSWKIEKAITEVAGGDLGSGIEGLTELAAANPKSLRIQLEYARALSKQAGGQDIAVKQWRRLATKVKKGSDAWYESKYNIVELMMANNQVDEAQKLIRYLQATSTGWQQSKWKPKFDRLLRK